MKIVEPFRRDINVVRENETPSQEAMVAPFDRDSIEAYKESSLPEAKETENATGTEAHAPPPAEQDDGFQATSLLPFGIGYWLDDEGSFADDFGKTILSIIIPIPFVSGLIADAAGPWLGNAIVNSAEWGAGAVKDSAEWGAGAIEDTAGWIGGAAEDAADWTGEAVGDAVDTVGDAAESVGDFLGDLW